MDTESDVKQIIGRLDQIRISREQRGTALFGTTTDIIKSFRNNCVRWHDEMIEDLEEEIDLMNKLVPYEELLEKGKELRELENRYAENKKKLDSLISSIERKEIKSFEDIDFGVISEAFNIATKMEETEKSVETTSRFIRNVIVLATRIARQEV